MLVTEVGKKKLNTRPKLEVEEMVKKKRKEEEKMVKGKFEFIDAQGGWIDFNLRIYPGSPIERYNFVHGEVCEIPLGVVKHINNTIKKVRKFNNEISLNSRGVPSTYEVQSRIRFTPMEYI